MKKTILMFVVATFIGGTIKAQSDTRDQLHFGLKIGANLSNVYDSKSKDYDADAKFGLATGAFLSIPIGQFLGVQPEILFSQKEFKATGTLYTFTRTTNYIDIPLLVAIKPVPSLTILAGPQYSYLIKQKDEVSGPLSSIVEKEFKNDNIRKNTLCFTGGLDFNFETIVLGARVGWDLYNNNGDGSSTTPRYKNVWYQATIGFRF